MRNCRASCQCAGGDKKCQADLPFCMGLCGPKCSGNKEKFANMIKSVEEKVKEKAQEAVNAISLLAPQEVQEAAKNIAATKEELEIKLNATIEGFKAKAELKKNEFATNNPELVKQVSIFKAGAEEEMKKARKQTKAAAAEAQQNAQIAIAQLAATNDELINEILSFASGSLQKAQVFVDKFEVMSPDLAEDLSAIIAQLQVKIDDFIAQD